MESPLRSAGWLTARLTSDWRTFARDGSAFIHGMSSNLATLFAYPWDLHDEQVDCALGYISETAGFNSICVALSYHTGTYFLPHNPVKKLYYGENGAIYFQPDSRHYAGTNLKPRVSSVVAGESYIRRIREEALKRQVEFSAWVVYFYNHHLAQVYPDCAKVDAFDSPYLSLLCPANPQVRAYALALTRDIVENCEPQSINLESVSYRHFDYGFLNPKVLVELSPYQRLLMGLCFCPHCLAAADRAGLDGLLFKHAVSRYLVKSLSRDPPPDECRSVSNEGLDHVFGGDLVHFLSVRSQIVHSLFEELTSTIRSYGDIKIQMVMPEIASESITGLKVDRTLPLLDRVFASAPYGLEKFEGFLGEMKSRLPPTARFLPLFQPDHLKDAEHTRELVVRCRADSADGYAFYNYGLARRHHLEWLGAASRDRCEPK